MSSSCAGIACRSIGSYIGGMDSRLPFLSTFSKAHETGYNLIRCEGEEAMVYAQQTCREVAYDVMMISGLTLLVACAKINTNKLQGSLEILKKPISSLNKGWNRLFTKFGTMQAWNRPGVPLGTADSSFFTSLFNLTMGKAVNFLNRTTESRLLIICDALLLWSSSWLALCCSITIPRERDDGHDDL